MKLYKKIFIALFAIIICTALILLESGIISNKPALKPATVKIEVTDGLTRQPVSGAKVVIPETGKTYTTKSDGLTDEIQVPILKDSRFEKTLPQDWGCFTVLVYKEPYIDYALFYTQAKPGETRLPIKIYMFVDDNPEGNRPFSVVEGPTNDWVVQMLKKYEPKG